MPPAHCRPPAEPARRRVALLFLLQVKQIQEFKRSLPKETKLIVCKNTLMKRAADSVEGWSELKGAAKVPRGVRGRGQRCRSQPWQTGGLVLQWLLMPAASYSPAQRAEPREQLLAALLRGWAAGWGQREFNCQLCVAAEAAGCGSCS